MSLARKFIEKFDPDIQKDVEKWRTGIPTYDDISQVSREYWNKAKEIVNKKYPDSKEDYWVRFFDVLHDLTVYSR